MRSIYFTGHGVERPIFLQPAALIGADVLLRDYLHVGILQPLPQS